MGIESTIDIDREDAIRRIEEILHLILQKQYRLLEENTYEEDYNLQKYVENFVGDFNITHIKKFTNKMLEDIMDRPFFRRSMFENYNVES